MMKLVPPVIFTGPEGLAVTVSPEGDAVLKVADPHGAHLVPERAVSLAFDLLGMYAPDLLEALERAVRSQTLRLVQGGSPEDAA